MNGFAPKMNTLPPPQRAVWNELAFTAEMNFVLYGGTAIALRLGHRTSVDFDFFRDEPLDKDRILRETTLLHGGQVIQNIGNTLTFSTMRDGGPVKISLFGGLVPAAFAGRVGKPERTDDNVMVVAALEDLFATKVKVILDRAEAKDYHDIAALVRAGYLLEAGLGAAVAIYGRAYQPADSLKALTYYEDGDLATVSAEERKLLTRAAASVRDLPVIALAAHSLAR